MMSNTIITFIYTVRSQICTPSPVLFSYCVTSIWSLFGLTVPIALIPNSSHFPLSQLDCAEGLFWIGTAYLWGCLIYEILRNLGSRVRYVCGVTNNLTSK